MTKFVHLALLSLVLVLGTAPLAKSEELNLDFTLVNKTGYTIKEIYVAPTSSDNWEEDILNEPLKNGESLDVSFVPTEKSKKWDLRIVWADGDAPVVWTGYDLTEISKLTLLYNNESGVTSAKTE